MRVICASYLYERVGVFTVLSFSWVYWTDGEELWAIEALNMPSNGKKHASRASCVRSNFIHSFAEGIIVANVVRMFVLSAPSSKRLSLTVSMETLLFDGATNVHGLIVGWIKV